MREGVKVKAVGFNAGQYGDLVMNLLACKAFKEKHPESSLHFGIAKKYFDIFPLFEFHPHIDKIVCWENYDGWPSENDKKLISEEKYDHVFDAMPQHTKPNWFVDTYQPDEVCLMHGLTPPKDKTIYLNKPSSVNFENTIAITPFGSFGDPIKSLSIEKCSSLVSDLKKLNYKVFQIGSEKDPTIPNVEKVCGSWRHSAACLLGCKLLITVDTAMSWISSAFQFPTLGLYGDHYMCGTSRNFQPFNPNAFYLEAYRAESISNELIIRKVRDICGH